jgi:adenosylmethionine-8-amino-7-oxononanoate aminotransferase
MLDNMRKTIPCNAYQGPHEGESDGAYVDRLTRCLEEDIKANGQERICAFVGETISGAVIFIPYRCIFRDVSLHTVTFHDSRI